MSTTPLNIYSPNIIHVGLTGKRGSGKSSAAKMFKYYFPEWYIYHVGFADEIKQLLVDLTAASLDTVEANKHEPMLRSILQFMGSKLREIDSKYLIEACKSKIEKLLDTHENRLEDKIMVIYEDVRMLSEATFVRAVGGVDRSFIYLVERTAPINLDASWHSPIQTSIDTHITETELTKIKWDHVIVNDHTLEFLRSQVGYIAGYIKEHLDEIKYGQHLHPAKLSTTDKTRDISSRLAG